MQDARYMIQDAKAIGSQEPESRSQ